MNLISDLLKAYKEQGYDIRTGLNPSHFNNDKCVSFTALFKNNKILCTGGGIGLKELYFFECLFSEWQPKNIFCIGNAFGWSTVSLALLNRNSDLICIDAGQEGDYNMEGIDITNKILHNYNQNARVVFGHSPEDVSKYAQRGIDFVFIDGLHTNEQQLIDWQAIFPHCHVGTVYIFHDVIQFNMEKSFAQIASKSKCKSLILHRTDSGMGILYPAGFVHENIIKSFTQEIELIEQLPKANVDMQYWSRRFILRINKMYKNLIGN